MFDLKRFSKKPALISLEESLSYIDLEKISQEINDFIPRRSLILLLCTNSYESICGYLGFINSKNVPIMLDAKLSQDNLNLYLETYQPNFAWLPTSRKALLPLCEEIFCLGGYSLIKLSPKSHQISEELALLMPTSGSTGSQKLVRQTYNNILANTNSIIEYLNIDSSERSITSLPMNYTYGLSVINTFIFSGGSILVTEKNMIDRTFWQDMENYQITHLSGVPYSYSLMKKLKFFDMHLKDLQVLTQAGGKLSEDLHVEFHDFAVKNNKTFYVMYGQTEATSRISYLPFQVHLKKKGSIGIAIPGGNLMLRDDKGDKIVTPFVEGEIIYEGENVSMGYSENLAELNRDDDFQGLLLTGDLGYFDEDNFFYVTGRKSRFIKIYGNRINLDEVENILMEQLKQEVVCNGSNDNLNIDSEKNLDNKQVKTIINNTTGIALNSISLHKITKIPRTTSGKISYKGLTNLVDNSK